MKSVWCLETGAYSDYHIVGIFTSKENALIVAEAMQLGETDVHEWVLNPAVKELNRGMWQWVVLMLRDGTVERITRVPELFSDFENKAFVWDRPNVPMYKNKGISSALQATVWARNPKHATKIVGEIRTQKIANNEWPSDK